MCPGYRELNIKIRAAAVGGIKYITNASAQSSSIYGMGLNAPNYDLNEDMPTDAVRVLYGARPRDTVGGGGELSCILGGSMAWRRGTTLNPSRERLSLRLRRSS